MKYFAVLLALLLSACGGQVPTPKSPQAYLQEGEQFYQNRLYEDAIAAWEKVRDSYYSPELNTLAEFKIAMAHFQAEHYIEAAAALEDYLKQHPNDERAPEALYTLGLAYDRQILSVDRDQTATRNALATFREFVRRYPDDPRSAEARALIRDALEHLAAHELYVGHFYLKTGHPLAAVGRLETIVRDYPDFSRLDQVLFELGRGYLETGQRQKAAETLNTLYQRFPDSSYVADAQRIVAKEF